MRTTLYINYARNPILCERLFYNLPPGWVEQGVGHVLIPQHVDLNNPIALNEDNSFIGPQQSVNETLSYINNKFLELKNSNMILDYKIKLFYD